MSKITKPFGKLKPRDVGPEEKLTFGTSNVKLKGSKTATFSLPAGYSCPCAKKCLAWVDQTTKKLVDGEHSEFRCYAASQEAVYTNVWTSVYKNYSMLQHAKTTERMAAVIDMHLPSKYYKFIRVHADGDFFNQSYFLAWMEVARRNPDRIFYAYTKNISMWKKCEKLIPDNFAMTASLGGTQDHLIEEYGFRYAQVVYHPDEAEELGLEVDHDDSHARSLTGGSFGLLIHGQQKKSSKGSAAIKKMKDEGVQYAYSRKKLEKL